MRAAVVGLGAVTPLGSGVGPTWAGLREGRSGIGPIRRFDARRYPVTFAAEGPAVGGITDTAALGRAWLDAATTEALDGVALDAVDPERLGVFVGAEAARPHLDVLDASLRGHPPDREALQAHAPWAPTARLVSRLGARGPAATLSTACTSSGQAVGEALLALERGAVDVAVAAGVDVLVHPLMLTGFARLGALSTRNDDPGAASRPFDRDRDGFVLGEGAGVMVLARPEVAGRLGAVQGWVSGYGCTSNAWRITDSPPDGRGAAEAMRIALAHAGRAADEVAWVHAHATSTRQNDLSEARALHGALGPAARRVAVSGTKSMLGHLVAACGVVGAIVAVRALADRVAPPTLNLDHLDPDCDLHVVGARAEDLGDGVALVNAFGFGGVNASLVVEGP